MDRDRAEGHRGPLHPERSIPEPVAINLSGVFHLCSRRWEEGGVVNSAPATVEAHIVSGAALSEVVDGGVHAPTAPILCLRISALVML